MATENFKSERSVESSLDETAKKGASDKKVRKGFKPKSKKPFNRRSSSSSKFKGGNDFSFWNEYPELMGIAAKYPWMHIAGTRLYKLNVVDVPLNNVAIQSYLPIPGFQDGASSPLNLTFRQMYLDMHRKYRGIGSYQASDIAITMLCIESALQMIVDAERLYGVLNYIPVRTRIQPIGLARALGFSASMISNVLSNMADFRYRINRLIDLAKRLPLPSGFSFFTNHVALNAFVYKDSEDDRADLLAFVCAGYFHYVTTGSADCINGAGTAVLSSFTRSGFSTYDSYLNAIEAELKNLLYDSDILRITSDFIACYGEENMQVLQPLPEDYQVIPQYSESILLKWHCSEFGDIPTSYVATQGTTQLTSPKFAVYQASDVIYSMPSYSDNGSTSIWYNVGSLYYYGSQTTTEVIHRGTHFVDTWEDDPSDATRCEALLWKREDHSVAGTAGGNTVRCTVVDHFCTELLTGLTLYSIDNGDLVSTSTVYFGGQYITTSSFNGQGNKFAALDQFDWHPYMFSCTANGMGLPGVPIVKIFGDTDNVSMVEGTTISKVVDAALLSAFKVKINFKGGSNL